MIKKNVNNKSSNVKKIKQTPKTKGLKVKNQVETKNQIDNSILNLNSKSNKDAKRGIVVVCGKDNTGIVYKICKIFVDNNVNILETSQTIMLGYFNMIMIVDLAKSPKTVEVLKAELKDIAKEIGVRVTLQLEDIFTQMHRI